MGPLLAGRFLMISRFLLVSVLAGATFAASEAAADKIKNPTAIFAGLDKITGRIISFEVSVDETVQFGALQLTARSCYTRPPTENPNTTGFIEVDEVTLDNKYRRIFSGWMFAASPGLHGIEHAIYDVWLTDCKGGTEVIVEAKEQEDVPVAGQQRSRRQQQAQPRPGASPQQQAGVSPSGRLDVAPPRGVPVQPQQQPTRRFYPTNQPANPVGGFFDSLFGGRR